jgi:hypothetical protein
MEIGVPEELFTHRESEHGLGTLLMNLKRARDQGAIGPA